MKKNLLLSLIALSPVVTAQAQTIINWSNAGEDNNWSNAENWQDENIVDSNAKSARITFATATEINVDQNFTINSLIDGFAGPEITHTIAGPGLLTIDKNSAALAVGIDNATGNEGGTLRFNGNIRIANSQEGVTTVRNINSSGNKMLFDTGSSLTLNTILRTIPGIGGTIEFNGTLSSSLANLQIGSNNVSFGAGHNSADFGADVVLLGNSRLTIDGGIVLNNGRRFQVNGHSHLVLSGANAINGANITVGGSHNLLLAVNANQANMGALLLNDGVLTIDLHAGVTGLALADSSALEWGSGSIQINGFREGVIRFGTDATGLTEDQLAAIAAGPYSLTSTGFLTTGAPSEVPEAPALAISLSESDLSITCLSVAGFDYTLAYSTDLSDPWIVLETQAGTGSNLTFTRPAPSAGAKLFYRVEVRTASSL